MGESRDVNYYEVLNIPFLDSATPLSTQQIKAAYHKALLRHHPDKASNVPASKASQPAYSVDDITNAYKTLIDPVKRAEYDRTLRLRRDHLVENGQLRGADVFRTGLEVVDLEDLRESDSQTRRANCTGTANAAVVTRKDSWLRKRSWKRRALMGRL